MNNADNLSQRVSLLDLWFGLPREQRDKEFLPPKQVAPLLAVREAQVRFWFDNDAEFPAIRLVGRIWVHEPSLREWIISRAQKTR